MMSSQGVMNHTAASASPDRGRHPSAQSTIFQKIRKRYNLSFVSLQETTDPVATYYSNPFISVFCGVFLIKNVQRLSFFFFSFFIRCGTHKKSLVTGDVTSLHRSGLNASRKVLFICHGYLEHGNKKWIKVCVGAHINLHWNL